MRRLVWLLALVAAALWSLLAWGAYALVGWFGGLVATNADSATGHPEAVVWLSWIAGLFTDLGLAGVVVTWLVGLGLILVLPAALRLVGGRTRGPGGHGASIALRRPSGSPIGPILRSGHVMRRLLTGGRRWPD